MVFTEGDLGGKKCVYTAVKWPLTIRKKIKEVPEEKEKNAY